MFSQPLANALQVRLIETTTLNHHIFGHVSNRSEEKNGVQSKMQKSSDPMPLPSGGALDAVDEQGQLLRPQAPTAAFTHGSGKATSLQSFCVKNQSRPVPKENFQPIACSVHENEQKAGGRLLLQ